MPHKRRLTFALLVLLLVGIVPAASGQVAIALPDLSGTFAVSRTNYDLTDTTRDETFTEDSSDKREILLTIYYPSAPSLDAETAPYMSDALKRALAQQAGIPYALLNIDTHVTEDQRAASGEYPVLVFAPGFGNLPAYYTSLLEDVASHGYVIAAIWTPYSTALVEFPDGRIVAANELGTRVDDQHFEQTGMVWTEDARFTLDSLETLNQSDSILAGHLDLEHVGAFGHSFGGATAAEFAHDDARVDAAINMDGTMFGEVAQDGMSKPFMMMSSELVIPSDDEMAAAGVTREQVEQTFDEYHTKVQTVVHAAHPGYRFELNGAAHNTYSTDMLSVAEQYGAIIGPDFVGTIDHQYAFELIRSYVVAFFDQALKGATSTLLNAPAADADVTFEAFNTN